MPTTDMEIFQAELKRARDLGLDLNKLDLDALNDTLMSGENFGQASGVFESASSNANDVSEAHGDNAFFAYNIPKTGNRELDNARLEQALRAQSALDTRSTILEENQPLGGKEGMMKEIAKETRQGIQETVERDGLLTIDETP